MTTVERSAPLVLPHLRGRPAEARTELIGHYFDLRPLVTFCRLPAALLKSAGNDHPCSTSQGLAHVLRHFAPAHDVEKGGRFLPLLRLAILPAAVHGQAEARCGLPVRGESQFRVTGDGEQIGREHVLTPVTL